MHRTSKSVISILLMIWSAALAGSAAEGDILWSRTYGTDGEEYAYSMIPTPEGGFLLAGTANRPGTNDVDAWILKVDAAGDSLWSKLLGGRDTDVGYCLLPAEDGFVVAGYTYSFGAGEGDMWLMKTDLNGDSLWSKTYGGSSFDCAYAAVSTQDGGYILAGETWSFGGDASNVFIVKTNELGDSLWSKTFAWSGPEIAYDILQTSEGGYLLAGERYFSPSGGLAAFLIKTDAAGDSLWSQVYSSLGMTSAHSVLETVADDYVFAGDLYSPWAPADSSFLTQVDASGNVIWSNTYTGSGVYSVIPTLYDKYFMVGNVLGGEDSWMAKTDSLGDTLWTKISGLTGDDAAADAVQDPNGDFYVAGSAVDPEGLTAPNFLLFCLVGERMELQVSTGILDYGMVEVGSVDSLLLSLYNTGTEIIAVSGIYSSNPVFYTNFLQFDSLLIPGDSLLLEVYFNPASDTVYNEWLTIASTAETTQVSLVGEAFITGIKELERQPNSFILGDPFPNPFNPTTAIRFQIPDARHVSLIVYDTKGRLITTLVDGWREAGSHEITFGGSGLPSGVYIYHLQAGDQVANGKMVLLK